MLLCGKQGCTIGVQTSGSSQGSIWMEGQGVDSPAVPLLFQDAVPCADVPQPPSPIEGCGAKVVALRVEPYPAQPLGVAWKRTVGWAW